MDNSRLRMSQSGIYGSPVYTLDAGEELSVFDDGMIMNNTINGIMNYVYEQRGYERIISYNAVSGIRLSVLRGKNLGMRQIVSILSSIADVINSAVEYMLIETNFVFDDDFIFIDPNTFSVQMVYVPSESFMGKTFVQYIKEFITNGVFDPNESADYRMRILNFVNANPQITAQQIKSFLQNLHSQPVVPNQQPIITPQTDKQKPAENNIPAVNIPPVQPKSVTNEPAAQKHKIFGGFGKKNEKKPAPVPKQNSSGIMAGMMIPGEESVMPQNNQVVQPPQTPVKQQPQQPQKLQKQQQPNVSPAPAAMPAVGAPAAAAVIDNSADYSGGTVLINRNIGAPGKFTGCLISSKGNRIIIDKPNFMIGKANVNGIPNDFDINNLSVSRQHAIITTKENRFYVVDSSSLNGTFVNGSRLQAHVEVELHNGDFVTFANEVFKFEIIRE